MHENEGIGCNGSPVSYYFTTRVRACVCVVVGGGEAAQKVKSASPQLAPTAPAPTVFIALSSVFQNQFSEFAVRKVNGFFLLSNWLEMRGEWLGLGQCPSSLLHCTGQLPPVELWAVQTFSEAYAVEPSRSAVRAVPPQGEGRACRSGVIKWTALAVAGPARPCCPLYVVVGGGGGLPPPLV